MSTHDDMLDAVKYLWDIMAIRTFIVFNEDGTFIEHEQLPEITSLTQYARASNADVWWSVQILHGTNRIAWSACTPDDVPKGLRLVALIVL